MCKIPITNPWSCLPAAFSMACAIPFGKLITLIGHTGDSLLYKNAIFKAGFHVQEIIEVIDKLGWSCTPVELFPQITPDGIEERTILFTDETGNWKRFLHHLTICKRGVIEGLSVKANRGHAVCWDGSFIYDPKGKIYSFAEHQQFNFYPRVLWKLKKYV